MAFGAQIVAIIVILVVTMEFFHYRRLRLLSTKMFETFLVLCVVSVVAEMACTYAILHPEYFSISASKAVHQFFFVTLNFLTWYVFMYVDIRCRPIKNYSLTVFSVKSLPLLFSIIMVLFGDIDYHVGDDGVYSYGSIVNSVYYSFACYIILIFFTIMRFRNYDKKLVRYDFLVCLLIWTATVITQFLFPTIIMSSVAVSVIALFFYIVFENTGEFTDKDIPSAFSRHSFEKTVKELFIANKRFWVINFSLQNVESMRATYGQRACMECLEKSIYTVPELGFHNMFRTLEYSFGFIVETEDELKQWYARYKVSDKALSLPDNVIQPTYFVSAIECPAIARNTEELMRLLAFCKNNFDAQNDSSIRIIDRTTAEKREHVVAIERLVQRAIDEDGFDVYYQPIINSRTGKCEAAEALVRLKDSTTLGFISPEVFIPIAEKKGVISMLSEQVLNKVCQFIKKERLDQIGLKYIDVNLSGLQMKDPSLPYRLHQAVRNFDLNPKFINFEVTETAAVENGKTTKDNISKLRKLGYKFSMDDFGTGYSNFSNIASIKYDLIKIDKSIIWQAFEPNNKQSMTVLLAMINMIHAIGGSIVAEGVETDYQSEFLTETGIEFQQGYFFSKPLDEQGFLTYANQNM